MDRRVLAVDDDPAALNLLERQLSEGGYRVTTAREAHEALRILLDDELPLLVTDWEMPGMSGLDLCRAIRAHEGIGFVYVIVLTAHPDGDRLVEAFEAGADDYMVKPCNQRELLARLRAGERIVTLEDDLARRTREAFRWNAELKVANQKLAIANDKLERMATTDELTGLINRRAAMIRLEEYWAMCVRHGEPLSCIMVDIDHFKNVNDTHGHAAGDELLRRTAASLRALARREDAVCRIGGEEFLIICPKATAHDASICAERQRAALESGTKGTGDGPGVTISAGIAERTPDMAGPDDLLRSADEALYAAKRSGRNAVYFAGQAVPVTACRPAAQLGAAGPARVV